MGKYESFHHAYDRMMSGETVSFPQNLVWDMLMHMDYFRINTLHIQGDGVRTTNITKWFACMVDEPTKKAYLKEKQSEMRIV